MVKHLCPGCETLREIVCTGQRQNPERGTSMWWSIVVHKHPDRREVCPGSGTRV